MNFKQLFPLVLLALSIAALSGCKNEDDDSDTVANVAFSFDFSVDGEDFVANDVYTINGVAVSFEIAQFYVSGITFMPEDGDPVSVDKHMLVTPTSASEAITELNKGKYQTITFDIGVQADANDQSEEDFTSRSSEDPLSMQQPSMHWNWSSGYKFIRLDGLADVDGDGTPETPIAYHLGTNNFLTEVTNMLDNDVEADETEMTIEVDIAKLFTDFDMTVDLDTHTANNIPLAERFATNLATAFSIK